MGARLITKHHFGSGYLYELTCPDCGAKRRVCSFPESAMNPERRCMSCGTARAARLRRQHAIEAYRRKA